MNSKKISPSRSQSRNIKYLLIGVLAFSLCLRLFYLFFTGGFTSPYITSDSFLYRNYVLDILSGNTRLLYTGAQLEGESPTRFPSFLYFEYLVLGYLLTGDLMGSKIIMAFLSILPLYFSHLFLQKINPKKPFANLTIIFLYALNFNNLLFNISNWNSNFIGILAPIMIYYLYLWAIEKQEKAFVKLSFLHCLLVQFHIFGYFLLPFYPIYFLLSKRLPKFKILFYAFLPWFIFISAFIIVDKRYDFNETIKLYHFIKGNQPQSRNSLLSFLVYGIFYMSSSPIAFFYYRDFFSESYLFELFPENSKSFLHVPFWMSASYAVNLFLVFSMLMFLVRHIYFFIKKKRFITLFKHPFLPIALWLVIPLFIYFISKRPYNPRYAQLFLPFNFVFLYFILFHVCKKKYAAKIMGIGYIALHLVLYVPFFSFLNNLTSNHPYFIASDKNLSTIEQLLKKTNSEKNPYLFFEPAYLLNPKSLASLNFKVLNNFFIPKNEVALKNPSFYIILNENSDFLKENSKSLLDGEKISSTKNLYLYKVPTILFEKDARLQRFKQKIDEERLNSTRYQTL